VRVDIQPKLPSVAADSNQLHQALLNLAVNARDAMPRGGVLTIRTSRSSGEEIPKKFPPAAAEAYLVIDVKDTGLGMDEDTRATVVDPYFTTKGAGVFGVGIPSVYGSVQHCRGPLEVESDPGKGTPVRLLFPDETGKVDKKS